MRDRQARKIIEGLYNGVKFNCEHCKDYDPKDPENHGAYCGWCGRHLANGVG